MFLSADKEVERHLLNLVRWKEVISMTKPHTKRLLRNVYFLCMFTAQNFILFCSEEKRGTENIQKQIYEE